MKYIKPEIETLALELIDVITASIGESGTGNKDDIKSQLMGTGLTEEQIVDANQSASEMTSNAWNW